MPGKRRTAVDKAFHQIAIDQADIILKGHYPGAIKRLTGSKVLTGGGRIDPAGLALIGQFHLQRAYFGIHTLQTQVMLGAPGILAGDKKYLRLRRRNQPHRPPFSGQPEFTAGFALHVERTAGEDKTLGMN